MPRSTGVECTIGFFCLFLSRSRSKFTDHFPTPVQSAVRRAQKAIQYTQYDPNFDRGYTMLVLACLHCCIISSRWSQRVKVMYDV
ncbi:hypothetical protein BDW60DRAFT_180534 [Aspergillus nidulans var. acristatus]